MGQYNFQKDLKNSEASVNQYIGYLSSLGADPVQLCHTKDYDVTYKLNDKWYSSEVKEDLMWESTGNVAIEYMCSDKPSGVTSSKADTWVYKLGTNLYQCNLEDLKSFLKSKPFRRVSGGDGKRAKMLLVPIDDFLEVFEMI